MRQRGIDTGGPPSPAGNGAEAAAVASQEELAAPEPSRERAVPERKSASLRNLARALRRMIGAPDYDAYLEHCRRAGHAPQLTREQFVAVFFAAKGERPRCC